MSLELEWATPFACLLNTTYTKWEKDIKFFKHDLMIEPNAKALFIGLLILVRHYFANHLKIDLLMSQVFQPIENTKRPNASPSNVAR